MRIIITKMKVNMIYKIKKAKMMTIQMKFKINKTLIKILTLKILMILIME